MQKLTLRIPILVRALEKFTKTRSARLSMLESVWDVVRAGCCVGCGACAAATNDEIKMSVDPRGALVADPQEDQAAIRGANVCPFSDLSPNEDALVDFGQKAALSHDRRLGYYSSLLAGRVTDISLVTGSSSGSLTSWFLSRALNSKLVDGVIHVGPSSVGNDRIFEYVVSHDLENLMNNRKSIYYPTEMSSILKEIRGNGKRYAFVGIPCFITALRLLLREDAELAEQIQLCVGLVCGHMKTAEFAECLSWQAGVVPADIAEVDFRIKDPNQPADRYSFGVRDKNDGQWRARLTGEMLSSDWGHGMFQLNSCNYCDDIFAETADICFGDAWLPQYRTNWRGTNLVVSRRREFDQIFSEGRESGELEIEIVTADAIAASQAANFRHRWEGLSVRLSDDIKRGLQVPAKRITPASFSVPLVRRLIVRARRRIGKLSSTAFARARDEGDFQLFELSMRRSVRWIGRLRRIERFIQKHRMLHRTARFLDIA